MSGTRCFATVPLIKLFDRTFKYSTTASSCGPDLANPPFTVAPTSRTQYCATHKS